MKEARLAKKEAGLWYSHNKVFSHLMEAQSLKRPCRVDVRWGKVVVKPLHGSVISSKLLLEKAYDFWRGGSLQLRTDPEDIIWEMSAGDTLSRLENEFCSGSEVGLGDRWHTIASTTEPFVSLRVETCFPSLYITFHF